MTPIFKAIAIAGALVVFAQGALADRRLATYGDLTVSVPSNQRCSTVARLYVDAPSNKTFAGERQKLEIIIGGAREILRLECSRIVQLLIVGRVGRRIVWKGYSKAADNWIVTDSRSRSSKRQATSQQGTSRQARNTNLIQGGAPGSALEKATTNDAKCGALFAWARRLTDEVPQSGRRPDWRRLVPVAPNLYGDEHFVPFYGRKFDTLSAQERRSFASSVRRNCSRPPHQRNWQALHFVINEPFSRERGRFSYSSVSQHVRTRRDTLAWMRRTLDQIAALPAEERSWQSLKRLEAEGNRRTAHLWPSEKAAFSNDLATRRTALANAIAAQSIKSVTSEPASLRRIDQIVATATQRLGQAQPNSVVLDLAAARKAEIRNAAVAKKAQALADIPPTVAGLTAIERNFARMKATLGDVPPAYRSAATTRVREISEPALQDYARGLRALPANAASLDEIRRREAAILKTLDSVAPQAKAPFREATEANLSERLMALRQQALQQIAAYRATTWGDIEKLGDLAEQWARRFDEYNAADASTEIKTVAAARAKSLIPELRAAFVQELEALPSDWTGYDRLKATEERLGQLGTQWPSFADYQSAIEQRRMALVEQLEAASLATVNSTGTGRDDLPAVFDVSIAEAKRFNAIGQDESADRLLAAGFERADRVAAEGFTRFLDALEKTAVTADAALELDAEADRLEAQGETVPMLGTYAAAARARANDIRTELCRVPFEKSDVSDKMGDRLIVGSDGPVSVFFFVCALDDNGHKVIALDKPFWSRPVLEIEEADGTRTRFELDDVDVGDDRDALLPVSVKNAKEKRTITRDEWQRYAGALMRERPHGFPDADGVTACDRLAADPEDPQRVADGVKPEDVDVDTAIEACLAAIEQDPGQARFHFQIGRALVLAGRDADALDFLETAAGTGYAAAESQLGDMLFVDEKGGDQNFEAAMAYYRRAAEGGYGPAKKLLAELGDGGTSGAGAGGELAVGTLKPARPALLERIRSGDYDWSLAFPKKETALLGYAQGLAADLGSWCPEALPQSALQEVDMFQSAWYGDTTSRIYFKGGFQNYLQKLQQGMGQKTFTGAGKKDAENVALNWGCDAAETKRLASNTWRMLAGRRPAYRTVKFETQLVEEKVEPVSSKHAYAVSTDGLSTPGAMRLDADMKQSRKLGLKVLECHYDTNPNDKYREVQYYWAPTLLSVIGLSAPVLGGNFMMTAQQKLQQANGGRKVTHPFLTYGSPRAECPARLDPDRAHKQIYGPRRQVASATPRKVGEPKRYDHGCCWHMVEYGAVPEDFVPDFPKDEEVKRGRTVVVKMDKNSPGALVKMSLQKFGWYSLTKSELNYRRQPKLAEALKDDVSAVFKQDPTVLECNYNSEKYGSVYFYRYWYEKRPKNTDPAYLKSRIRDHPLLLIRSPRTACPKTRSAAKAIH